MPFGLLFLFWFNNRARTTAKAINRAIKIVSIHTRFSSSSFSNTCSQQINK